MSDECISDEYISDAPSSPSDAGGVSPADYGSDSVDSSSASDWEQLHLELGGVLQAPLEHNGRRSPLDGDALGIWDWPSSPSLIGQMQVP
eukprot:SAG31_NODE_1845_length_7104_cov_2.447680_1_plen_90_part_00